MCLAIFLRPLQASRHVAGCCEAPQHLGCAFLSRALMTACGHAAGCSGGPQQGLGQDRAGAQGALAVCAARRSPQPHRPRWQTRFHHSVHLLPLYTDCVERAGWDSALGLSTRVLERLWVVQGIWQAVKGIVNISANRTRKSATPLHGENLIESICFLWGVGQQAAYAGTAC